ncbi:hypothetical protein MEQU1_002459 [Malassezia equina]|uniref:Uncharacterized protein n=1 Tax=Malassezia equina TaxID=1381935 RepID=A0AAF0EFQ4_9BASI|nr:hypothetical protein MEQU1_002459 [Malassezia equina]
MTAPSQEARHPGHKLLHILPDNHVPKSPYPDQWYMHPNVHCDPPPLKHMAAFMSALRTPSDGKSMPSIDIAQLGRATEQLINSIISSKRSETPSKDEVEEMLSQTFMASTDEDANGDTVSDQTEKYDEPAMERAEEVPNSIHSTPWEEALATNFQKLLQEQASQQDS